MKPIAIIIMLAASTGLLVRGLGELPLRLAEANLEHGEGNNLLEMMQIVSATGGNPGMVAGAAVALVGTLLWTAGMILPAAVEIQFPSLTRVRRLIPPWLRGRERIHPPG